MSLLPSNVGLPPPRAGLSVAGHVARLRVPAGFVAGIAVLCLARPTWGSLAAGGLVAAAGEAIRVWAAGHLEKGRALARSGPYAFTRNPLYFGSFLMALGILLAGQVYWLLLPFVAFFAAFYLPVMRREEQELLQGYGDIFLEYAGKVPLFFPAFRVSPRSRSAFSWSRVIANREHRAVAGLALTLAFLAWRSL